MSTEQEFGDKRSVNDFGTDCRVTTTVVIIILDAPILDASILESSD